MMGSCCKLSASGPGYIRQSSKETRDATSLIRRADHKDRSSGPVLLASGKFAWSF